MLIYTQLIWNQLALTMSGVMTGLRWLKRLDGKRLGGVRGSASSEARLSICANPYVFDRSHDQDLRASSLSV